MLVKINVFSLFYSLFRRFGEYMEVVLKDLLLPNLVWRSGRCAAAVRTAALSCVLALLHGAGLQAERVMIHSKTRD